MMRRIYYPLFADLAGRRCLVVGGGAIAQRKALQLLQCEAAVAVISPTVTRRLAALAKAGRVRLMKRDFSPADLRGVWLVIAATNDQRINEAVARAASSKRIFANIVDQPSLCSFIAPAIVRRSGITVAVSTGGASPSIAKRIRTEVGYLLARRYAPLLRLAAALRPVAKRKLPTYQDRKRYFDHLLNSPIAKRAGKGRHGEARRQALALLERAANGHQRTD